VLCRVIFIAVSVPTLFISILCFFVFISLYFFFTFDWRIVDFVMFFFLFVSTSFFVLFWSILIADWALFLWFGFLVAGIACIELVP